MDRSSIGTRMKSYEDAQKTYLTRRMPVMIRVDGNAFHTFTRGFERPFDSIMAESMQRTMKYMCENISGCVLGYTQSDEITLLLIDYKKKNQGAWFGYVKRKVETIAASMATMAFNEAFSDVITEKISEDIMKVQNDEEAEKVKDYYFKYVKKCGRAMFDARIKNLESQVEALTQSNAELSNKLDAAYAQMKDMATATVQAGATVKVVSSDK